MVDVPLIDKKSATVITDMGETLNLMDSETYETYEVARPADEELASKIANNVEVEVWDLMGRQIIVRVKS